MFTGTMSGFSAPRRSRSSLAVMARKKELPGSPLEAAMTFIMCQANCVARWIRLPSGVSFSSCVRSVSSWVCGVWLRPKSVSREIPSTSAIFGSMSESGVPPRSQRETACPDTKRARPRSSWVIPAFFR